MLLCFVTGFLKSLTICFIVLLFVLRLSIGNLSSSSYCPSELYKLLYFHKLLNFNKLYQISKV